TATLAGKHYQADGAICRPLPLQPSGIPLWIAGGGEQKTLRTAAKYAQYTNFDATAETWQRKSEILAQHCRDVGRDFGEITRTANFNVVIGETEQDVQAKLEWIDAHYRRLVSPEQAERANGQFRGGLTGTPEQIVERLREAERLGLAYAIGYFVDAAFDPSSVELFATRVVPELQ
ncbi:MAG TPA: LLM class flavin-dependent oxidoreductase, partial [Jatrophihabitans sp.]|nr:LLM class flavin-dependent oxidoreductase [Jatrophihabitans sp.]